MIWHKDCRTCQKHAHGAREGFEPVSRLCLPGGKWFDINVRMCLSLAKAKRQVPARIERELLEEFGRLVEVCKPHLDHVDVGAPGIVGTARLLGEPIPLLIDGTHRVVRALRDGLDFYAYRLTEGETLYCITDGTDVRRQEREEFARREAEEEATRRYLQ